LLRSAAVGLPVSGSKRDARTTASRATAADTIPLLLAGGNFGAIGFQVAVNEIVPVKDEQDKRDRHGWFSGRKKTAKRAGAENLRDLSPGLNSVRRTVYLNAMGEPTL